MFSRYVGAMLRRMTERAELVTEPLLDGFSVILGWVKPTSQPGERPVHETIAVFPDRPTITYYVAGRASIRDLARRASLLAYDGNPSLGPLKIQASQDSFVQTFTL